MTKRAPFAACAECGMVVEPGEYHPFAACLMFKACHNGGLVRDSLKFVAYHGRAQALEEAAKACEAEEVGAEATSSREDRAYNMALEHAAAAIRGLAKEEGQ